MIIHNLHKVICTFIDGKAIKNEFLEDVFRFLLIAFGEPLARDTKWAYLDCRLGWWALRKSVEWSVKSQSVWSRSETQTSFWLLAKWSRFLAKQTQRTHFFCLLFLVTIVEDNHEHRWKSIVGANNKVNAPRHERNVKTDYNFPLGMIGYFYRLTHPDMLAAKIAIHKLL